MVIVINNPLLVVDLFESVEKTRVVQDMRLFSQSPLDLRRCCLLIAKTLYLLYTTTQGHPDSFTRAESTAIFFATSKAFQCKDTLLRRLTLLLVRELAERADDVIIVMSSLMQDINSRVEPMTRANSIRSLGAVTDVTRFIE